MSGLGERLRSLGLPNDDLPRDRSQQNQVRFSERWCAYVTAEGHVQATGNDLARATLCEAGATF